MGQYSNGIEVESGSSDGQVDPAHVMEKILGILEVDKLKANFQTCNRVERDFFGFIPRGVEWKKSTF